MYLCKYGGGGRDNIGYFRKNKETECFRKRSLRAKRKLTLNDIELKSQRSGRSTGGGIKLLPSILLDWQFKTFNYAIKISRLRFYYTKLHKIV